MSGNIRCVPVCRWFSRSWLVNESDPVSWWRAAQLLLAGGQLDVKGKDGKLGTVSIVRVEQRHDVILVYNLEVSRAHSFYVGYKGILAHNGDGAYFLGFSDGTFYSGKGDLKRMKKSIRAKTKGGKRSCTFLGHANVSGTRNSFIAEDQMIEAAGGVRPGSGLLNAINSPGKRMRGR